MPWSGKSFAKKHNHKLTGKSADKAAKVATAMIKKGIPESEAIATGNARGEGKAPKRRAKNNKSDRPWKS